MASEQNTMSTGAFKKAQEDMTRETQTKQTNPKNVISLSPNVTESSGAFASATSLMQDMFKYGSVDLNTGSTSKDSGIFVDSDDQAIDRLVKSSGLYRPTSEEWYNKFSRFQTMNPWRRLNLTKEYLFFTKPDLRIYHAEGDTYINKEYEDLQETQAPGGLHYNNTFLVPFFKEMDLHYKYVLEQLQYSTHRNLPFMNLLSNAKRSNLELADINASGDIDTPVNLFGTKISYRGTSYSSDDGYDFTIDFEDSKYLEIYRLLKAYDLYENRKHQGLITIPDAYVQKKILHDQFSIYKFIVDEDYSTLVYWAKLTGCYIKSVPRTTFSDLPEGGGLTYTVQFRCSFIEDMTPEILSDFNRVAELIGTPSIDKTSSLYDKTIDSSNPDWCDYPYIVYDDLLNSAVDVDNNNVHRRPKLIWKNKAASNKTLLTLF